MKRRRPKSRECFYRDATGRISDAAIHDEILDNPEVDRAVSERAIMRAMAEGLSEEVARKLYGIPETQAIK